MRKTIAALCFTLLPAAHAAVDFNGFSHGGTGCPADGSGIRVYASSSEQGRLIIYTPDMRVDLNDGKSFDRKACNIAMPVDVPAGYRMVIGRPAVFGTEDLSSGETLDVGASIFFTGSTGPEVQVDLVSNGNKSAEFYRRANEEISLGCEQAGILRASTTLLARKASARASGDANVRGIAFNIRLEPCN